MGPGSLVRQHTKPLPAFLNLHGTKTITNQCLGTEPNFFGQNSNLRGLPVIDVSIRKKVRRILWVPYFIEKFILKKFIF